MTDYNISPRCPSPWMRPLRSDFISLYIVAPNCIDTGNLGQSWTCSYQATPPASRRYLLGDDTNHRHPLDYSLVLGSRLQNRLEMRAGHRWRKPPASSSCRDLLWLRMSLLWPRHLRMYQLRLSPQLHRRRRRTGGGRHARSCESRIECLPHLPPIPRHATSPPIFHRIPKRGFTYSLSWYIWIFIRRSICIHHSYILTIPQLQ